VEGRGNYEESWDPDVAEFMAIQGLVEDGHESGADAGGIHDSSDDDWKPVNYGKGKHYQKEKKKYHQKEKKRRAKKDAVATDTVRVNEGGMISNVVTLSSYFGHWHERADFL
jgi:hypothetical protein